MADIGTKAKRPAVKKDGRSTKSAAHKKAISDGLKAYHAGKKSPAKRKATKRDTNSALSRLPNNGKAPAGTTAKAKKKKPVATKAKTPTKSTGTIPRPGLAKGAKSREAIAKNQKDHAKKMVAALKLGVKSGRLVSGYKDVKAMQKDLAAYKPKTPKKAAKEGPPAWYKKNPYSYSAVLYDMEQEAKAKKKK